MEKDCKNPQKNKLEFTRERLISKIFMGEHADPPSTKWPDQIKFHSDGPASHKRRIVESSEFETSADNKLKHATDI